MQIIPSIDIVDGKCVRLLKGNYEEKTTYSARPAEMADRFISSGATSLHIVDLDGAKKGCVTNWSALQEILQLRGVEFQVGGGLRTESEVDRLLDLGATRVVIGSATLESPDRVERWVQRFGPLKFCVALDLEDGRLAHQGWLRKSDKTLATAVAEMTKFGITRFLSTDIRKDGTLEGPNMDLYAMLVQTYPDINWLASGVVQSVEDVRSLKEIGVFGAIIGKALFEDKLRLEQLLVAAC